jgi:hypothetical protein
MAKTTMLKTMTVLLTCLLMMSFLAPLAYASSPNSNSLTISPVSFTEDGTTTTAVVTVNGITYTIVLQNETVISITTKTQGQTGIVPTGAVSPCSPCGCPDSIVETQSNVAQPSCGSVLADPNYYSTSNLPTHTIYPWPLPNFNNPPAYYIYLNAATAQNFNMAVALIVVIVSLLLSPLIGGLIGVDYAGIYSDGNVHSTLTMWIPLDAVNLFFMGVLHEWYMAMGNHVWLLCGLGVWNVGSW